MNNHGTMQIVAKQCTIAINTFSKKGCGEITNVFDMVKTNTKQLAGRPVCHTPSLMEERMP